MMSAADEVVLHAQGLCKRYGDVQAVDDVGFVLRRGESLGIVGESGSGKSTTARLLVGLEEPDEGEVALAGGLTSSPRTDRRARARAIQMIFQDPYQSFDPRLRIADAIAEPLRLHLHLSRRARNLRVTELLDQVGLSERQGRARPRELSGGQRQRAAIARALGVEPAVLVLDEAVAALDVSIQAQVIALLNEIRASSGVSFVFVSHDLGVIRYVSDHAVVMRRGRIIESGATEDLLAAPSHPYTQLLLDSVPQPGWDLERLSADRRAMAACDDTPEVT